MFLRRIAAEGALSRHEGAGRRRRPGRAEIRARRFFLAAALALAALSFAAFLVPALLSVPPRAVGAVSWHPTAVGAGVLIGLLLRELRGAWIMLALGIGLLELPRLLAGRPDLPLLANVSQTLLVGLVVGFVGTVLLRLSRASDAAAAGRERAAAAAAAAAGAGAARARASALVHDEVLSTLNLAAASDLVDGRRLAEQAGRARDLLAEASADAGANHDAEASDDAGAGAEAHAPRDSTLGALRDDVTALDPEAEYVQFGRSCAGPGTGSHGAGRDPAAPVAAHESGGGTAGGDAAAASAPLAVRTPTPETDVPVPPAVRGAVRQALRNSLLHAGPGARRRVMVERLAGCIRVVVSDDGVGFDPDRVPAHRLGLRAAARAVQTAGGALAVSSAPGRGTRASIEWPDPAQHRQHTQTHRQTQHTQTQDPALSGARPLEQDPAASAPALARAPLVRLAVAIAAVAFTALHALLAAASAPMAEPRWAPFLVLVLLLGCAALLQRRFAEPLSGGSAVLSLLLIAGAMAVGLLGSPFEVGELWFAGASAFLLAALAFRGRPIAAAAGGLLVSGALTASGITSGVPPFVIVSVSVRPLGVVGFAVALSFAVAALLRRTAHDLAAIEAESARESWERSARAELAAQAGEVRALVDGLLGEIELGHPLSEAARSRALALEGRLRDRIRAGRLAREPLLSAAMRARARGVDVLLLDDLDGGLPEGFDPDRTAVRLAAACDTAAQRATVRILPAGRSAVISLVIDGSPVELPENR